MPACALHVAPEANNSTQEVLECSQALGVPGLGSFSRGAALRNFAKMARDHGSMCIALCIMGLRMFSTVIAMLPAASAQSAFKVPYSIDESFSLHMHDDHALAMRLCIPTEMCAA